MDEESVNILQRLKDGDKDAATELHDRFAHRLIALARSRISKKLARRVDPEDVVQSVYRSFFANADDDRYVFEKSGDMWRLLSSITVNKVLRQVQKHTRKKRSINAEQSVMTPTSMGLPPEMLASGPSPSDALTMIEEMESVMGELDQQQRQVLELRLQGRSTEQIAREFNKSERTIRRTLEKTRAILEQRLLDVQSE